ncbi:MAG: YHS domain-containing (seleno)protein [Xenococcaceae cyanobacterium MO_167.B52]|nr:YHS domain-containing (seleno)protein [Xenococcaceae cyanobacterium MO_167.B52]
MTNIVIMKNIYLITTLTVLVLGVGTTLVSKTQANTEYDNAILISKSDVNNDQVFYQQRGIAIKGTDTVAYFTEGKAVKGDKKYNYQWGNTTWWFKNETNRDLFAQNPEQYAPQFGGFCAWAVSQNYTAPINPQAWKIVDGKLYLNYNKSVQRTWAQDIQGNIIKGHRNWPNLLANLQN